MFRRPGQGTMHHPRGGRRLRASALLEVGRPGVSCPCELSA
jgi:hypothetical protein